MTTDDVGGVWSFSIDLASELRARGHEVHLAVVGPDPSSEQRAYLERAAYAWEHRRAKLEWMDDPWDDVAATGEWLQEVAGRVRPDLVHLNDFAHAPLPWRRPVVVVAHSDVVTWWRAVHGVDPPPAWRRYRSAVEAGLAAADAVVAPTRALVDAMRASYSFPRDADVVPNGTSAAGEVEDKEPLVVAAGRAWDRAKNAAAVARVAEGLSWPVCIAGAGAADEGAARRLGHLTREDLGRLLARAAIFAGPSFYEPFGLSALEAAKHGCALVLGDIPSLREVWGDAALYVDPADDAELRFALESLIAGPEVRADLARRARERASTYRIERTADGYLEVYERVLPDRHPRRQRGAVA